MVSNYSSYDLLQIVSCTVNCMEALPSKYTNNYLRTIITKESEVKGQRLKDSKVALFSSTTQHVMS